MPGPRLRGFRVDGASVLRGARRRGTRGAARAGSGAGSAQRVGEKLCQLSRLKQVICVTHLPQIAVFADHHFEIRKEERNGRTFTLVVPLDVAGRKREIARLTGGDNVTEVTLASAGEQIENANSYKKQLKESSR